MKALPSPLRSKEMKDCVQEWYANFVTNMNHETLFETILAANFMDIQPLVELTCAAVAAQIKDKRTPQEIAEHFGVKRPYVEPDERRIKEVYPWCVD